MIRALLVGNPNCGKTTLFNGLTGDRQRVGNWPGVTVEKKTGEFFFEGTSVEITDLPGVYSLVCSQDNTAQDEQVTALAVAYHEASLIINVVDASQLERHLYLTSQLLELGKPVVVVLNMMDIAKQRGIEVNSAALASLLHCAVFELEAHKNTGLEQLKQAIVTPRSRAIALSLPLPKAVYESLSVLKQQLSQHDRVSQLALYMAYRMLEGDTLLSNSLGEPYRHNVSVGDEVDILIADARYQVVHQLVNQVQKKQSDAREYLTAKLDRIFLHRLWSLPIFLLIMYSLFLFAMNIGGVFQEFVDQATNIIFVQGPTHWLGQWHAPAWLIALVANGIGKGVNTTLTFVPVIATMFFLLAFLEMSGYMARAAFIIDKLMRLLGLPGKSFVPMIVGFGCNVPAVMAARTLDSEHDRLLTILMTPFMSCSARLAIYAVFVAAFFPIGGQNVVFSLYVSGVTIAVLTGLLLRKTLLRGQCSPLILELPAYHRPQLKSLLRETLFRLRHFIRRAGKVIIPLSVVLGGLNAITLQGGINFNDADAASLLSWFGRSLTPIFSPMGIYEDNWPATVGLLTGMFAKEVVIGSLNALYTEAGYALMEASSSFNMWHELGVAFQSIPSGFSQFIYQLANPLGMAVNTDPVLTPLYSALLRHFDGAIGAYAYLLFILLYIPCISTMAVIRQEANNKLMWFSIGWSMIVAYTVSVVFYQLATFATHPVQSFGWVMLSCLVVAWFVGRLWHHTRLHMGGKHVIATS